ncbi:MAG: ABC transporter ATP-binding protein [Thermoflexales bacterium]|nr:ABC transporter ATP-binding protein [Thermoflexales bacterium]
MTKAGTLILENVTKEFKTPEGRMVKAVDAASLTIQPGEFLTLLGPSGCGKTTTLRMIAGFEFPSSGRIVLDGRDIAMVPPDKREMAMVFQSYALFPHLTVYENVAYGLRIRRQSNEAIRQKVLSTLSMVGLEGKERRRPSELSGGQQQRVALGRAMAIEPRVLLFDEPLSNLDAKLRVSLRSEIRRLQKQLGITSVYVTHDQAEAMALSDRIVVMNAGRIEQADTPDAIYARPANRFVADFIGRANVLPVEVLGVGAGGADVRLAGETHTGLPCDPAVKAGGSAHIVVRPQAMQVGKGGAGLPARVRSATYLGNMVEYELSWGEHTLIVEDYSVIPGGALREGEEARWTFAPSRAYVLPA